MDNNVEVEWSLKSVRAGNTALPTSIPYKRGVKTCIMFTKLWIGAYFVASRVSQKAALCE